jgi:hypothetical protein
MLRLEDRTLPSSFMAGAGGVIVLDGVGNDFHDSGHGGKGIIIVDGHNG